jgi:hypothetical protein
MANTKPAMSSRRELQVSPSVTDQQLRIRERPDVRESRRMSLTRAQLIQCRRTNVVEPRKRHVAHFVFGALHRFHIDAENSRELSGVHRFVLLKATEEL